MDHGYRSRIDWSEFSSPTYADPWGEREQADQADQEKVRYRSIAMVNSDMSFAQFGLRSARSHCHRRWVTGLDMSYVSLPGGGLPGRRQMQSFSARAEVDPRPECSSFREGRPLARHLLAQVIARLGGPSLPTHLLHSALGGAPTEAIRARPEDRTGAVGTAIVADPACPSRRLCDSSDPRVPNKENDWPCWAGFGVWLPSIGAGSSAALLP